MKINHNASLQSDTVSSEKILLALLPFWTPLVTPLGISCLNSYLTAHYYDVTSLDLNVEVEFKNLYDKYLDTLISYIHKDNSMTGNYFINLGNTVLRKHLTAFLNCGDKKEYIGLLKFVIYKTYFCHVPDSCIIDLDQVAQEFYAVLKNHFINLIEREKPTLLGLSVYSDSLPASLFISKLVREMYPSIKIVMGGSIFSNQLGIGTSSMKLFLEKTKSYIDKILIGEGEILFHKLLRAELPQSQRVYTLADIDRQILDLSHADAPDFSDLKVREYPYIGAYSSRSCPFQCSFCSETVNWGKYRKKEAKKVVKELVELNKKYKNQLFFMGDSLVNPIATDLAKELIKTDEGIYWDGYLRADKHVCRTDNTMLWRRGGFFRARLGIESGSPRVLERMGKQITIKQIKEALFSLAYAGIKTSTYWIVGHPGETEEDFKMTLELIKELKNNIYEAMCNPFSFYPVGQVNSQEWREKNNITPLYPEKAKNMLIVQSWAIDCEPSGEEAYRRLLRFVNHCNRLEIPNPYSLKEIYEAEKRWKKLHKNAVPALAELKDDDIYINETKDVKELLIAQNSFPNEGDFGF